MALGYAHPDYLLEDLSAEQVTEWEAFNRIQPIGAKRMDFYFSYLMTAIHNIAVGFSGSKDAKQFKMEDFVPNWTGIEKEEESDVMSAEEMKDFWKSFADVHNKQVDKEQKQAITPPRNVKK